MDWVKFAGKAAVLSGVTLTTIPVAISVAGFTGAGVAASSIAAAYQSTQARVIVAGSAFSVLQSVGVAGMALSTKAAIAGACTMIAAKL